MSHQRLNAVQACPDAYKALIGLETYLQSCGLEHSLAELIKTRASQINGCAFCLHMHTTDARKAGESEIRLHLLAAWRESSLYTVRERAALGWTEALTLVAQTGAPDADYAAFQAEFSPAEQVQVTALIGMINVWNRLAVGFRFQHPKAA
ncbi:carboxymuconolactone decarboxylase family protein [Elstera sp.]|jgi:AhpD family alkylhydroperoxidase|uniref:carboxymuconolactone decarboxylase family protein n=1 Tax=Elstera sp. TaxID=1916664 RepID=UPI0037C0EBBA